MMRRSTSNSWKHLGIRGGDGVLQALPFRAWIRRSDWSERGFEYNPRDVNDVCRVEWHTLNLDNGEISETLSMMPTDACEDGTAVACRNRIYVLGGRRKGGHLCPDRYCTFSHPVNYVFYFDCASSDCEWKKGIPMLVPRYSPSVVATRRKIYVFGSTTSLSGGHFAEVFDIEQNCWNKLPAPPVASDLDPRSVSHPVLFDSDRSRILVHFYSNNSLHAFRPHDGSWECLDPEFGDWTRSPVIVGSIAYFLVNLGPSETQDCVRSLRAYHLVDKKWFPVKWSNGDSTIPVSFPDLFHLGKDIMCLIFYSWTCGKFMYLKFRVRFESEEFRTDADPTSFTTASFQSTHSQVSVL